MSLISQQMSTFINRLLLLAFYVQHFPTCNRWYANINCPPFVMVSVIQTPLFRALKISWYIEILMIIYDNIRITWTIFLLSNPLYYK